MLLVSEVFNIFWHLFGVFFLIFFKMPNSVRWQNITKDGAKVGYSFQDDVDIFGVRAHHEKIFELSVPKSRKAYDFLRDRLDEAYFLGEG